MPLWTEITPPTFKPDAVLGDKGWVDTNNDELLVAMRVTEEEKQAYAALNNSSTSTPTPTPVVSDLSADAITGDVSVSVMDASVFASGDNVDINGDVYTVDIIVDNDITFTTSLINDYLFGTVVTKV